MILIFRFFPRGHHEKKLQKDDHHRDKNAEKPQPISILSLFNHVHAKNAPDSLKAGPGTEKKIQPQINWCNLMIAPFQSFPYPNHTP
ncbi:MAG: hypothetical protein K5841_06100 [Fretibacterium sp.]|nr:hypothetical protein [Fretibacterium sp.]